MGYRDAKQNWWHGLKGTLGIIKGLWTPNWTRSQSFKSLYKGNLISKIKVVQKEMDFLLEEKDMKWKQRAKQRLLKEGDRNTKLFHQCANQRRKKNTIHKISYGNGNVTTPEEMSENSKGISSLPRSFYNIPARRHWRMLEFHEVTVDMNSNIFKELTAQEVEDVIFQMKFLSSPGSDGFLAAFYKITVVPCIINYFLIFIWYLML